MKGGKINRLQKEQATPATLELPGLEFAGLVLIMLFLHVNHLGDPKFLFYLYPTANLSIVLSSHCY